MGAGEWAGEVTGRRAGGHLERVQAVDEKKVKGGTLAHRVADGGRGGGGGGPRTGNARGPPPHPPPPPAGVF